MIGMALYYIYLNWQKCFLVTASYFICKAYGSLEHSNKHNIKIKNKWKRIAHARSC